MAVKIQIRRGDAAEWSSENPLLMEGEIGIELDTGSLKIGNGIDDWNDLSYVGETEIPEANIVNTTSDAAGLITGRRMRHALKNNYVNTAATTSSLTINSDSTGMYTVTALAEALTINAPTGSPVEGQNLLLRIKDNETGRNITFNSVFRAIGVTLPAKTVAGKTLYVGCIYNTTDSKWDILAVGQEE